MLYELVIVIYVIFCTKRKKNRLSDVSYFTVLSILCRQIDRSKEFTEIERYLYDETNKRTRSTQDIRAGTERDYYDIIRLYTDVSGWQRKALLFVNASKYET